MTHHTVYAERAQFDLSPSGTGWKFTTSTLSGTVMQAARLCDIEPHVRSELQRRFGDVSEDTIEVKIGGRRRGTSAPDDSKRFINTAGRKRKPRRH